jgi:hypothetical protein
MQPTFSFSFGDRGAPWIELPTHIPTPAIAEFLRKSRRDGLRFTFVLLA